MRMMRVLLVAMLAACASAPRGRTPLEGTYVLEQVNGQALPAPSASEDGVTMHGGTLELRPGGRYALEVRASTASQPSPSSMRVEGAYRVAADSLAFVPEPASQGAEMRFRYELRGPVLHLHDDDGAFVFRRR